MVCALGTKLIYAAQYAVVRALAAVTFALPWDVARRGARIMGFLFFVVDRRRRKLRAVDNILRAFPRMDVPDAWRMLRSVYIELSESTLDGVRVLGALRSEPPEKLIELEGFEKLSDLDRGSGVVLVSGHVGCWEALTALPMLTGRPLWTLARGFRNPWIDRYVQRLRAVTGQGVLDKHGNVLRLFHLLRQGADVGLLIDQDARRHGVFVDFFGRPASTHHLAARLCLRARVPAALISAHRIPGRNRVRIVCQKVIRPRPDGEWRKEVVRITAEITSALEELIRKKPEAWLWSHRRWKTYPGKYGTAGAVPPGRTQSASPPAKRP